MHLPEDLVLEKLRLHNTNYDVVRSDAQNLSGFIHSEDALSNGILTQEDKLYRYQYQHTGFDTVPIISNNEMITAATEVTPKSQQIDLQKVLLDNNLYLRYKISPNIKNYLFVELLGFCPDLPNSNGIGIPYDQLIEHSIEDKKPFYKTFVGCPIYIEHRNNIPALANGVVFDVVINTFSDPRYRGHHRVMFLFGVDKTKNPALYKAIESGQRNAYSIGALTPGYRCSYCGAKYGAGKIAGCSHLNSRKVDFYIYHQRLVFKEALKARGFELSSVSDPAYPYAFSNVVHVPPEEVNKINVGGGYGISTHIGVNGRPTINSISKVYV